MPSSQQFVIAWFEFFIATAILLAVTKWILDRLRQPVDRINLIALSVVVSACMPLLLVCFSSPRMSIGLFPSVSQQHPLDEAAKRQPIPSQSPLTAATRSGPSAQMEAHEAHSTPQDAVFQVGVASAPSRFISSAVNAPEPASAVAAVNRSFDPWRILAVSLMVIQGGAIAWFLTQCCFASARLSNISRRATVAGTDLRAVWKQLSGTPGESVAVLVSDAIPAPMVYGLLRPKVLVPESIANGDRRVLRFCLAHEWSHVRNNDLAKWMLVNWCEVLLWYQPLLWVLRRELRVCQDLIADDYAAGISEDQLGRIHYSELLLSIAQHSKSRQPIGALALHERSSQLGRRIKTLLTETDALRPRSTRAFTCLSGFLLLAFAQILVSIRLGSAEAQETAAIKQDVNPPTASKEVASDQQTNPASRKIVRGRVVNAEGDPVPRAKLWLPLQFEPRRTAEATTDEAGKFELSFPTDWIGKTKRGSLWTVWVYAPGYSIQSQSVFEAIYGDESEEYTLQLPGASNTVFEVLTPDGEPLPNVLVAPQNYKTTVAYELIPEEMHPLVSFRTDANGQVRLPALETDLLFTIEMIHSLFGRQSLRVDGNEPRRQKGIQLRPVASIKGRVVGENPQWIRNVKLAFVTENRDEWNQTQGIAETVTDENGQFEVPAIASGGPLRTYVALDPKLPVRPMLLDNEFLSDGETVELEIPLVDAPIVRGKIVEQSTGKGVAKAEISLGYGSYRQQDSVTTDENGIYEGRTLPGDVRVHIIVLPDGLVQIGTPWNEPYQVPDNVEQVDLPTIEVIGTVALRGQLLDSSDQPLPKTSISAESKGRRYDVATTDSDGRFRLQIPDGIKPDFQVESDRTGLMPVQVITQDPLVLRCNVAPVKKDVTPKIAPKVDVKLTGQVFYSDAPAVGVVLKLHREVRGANGMVQYLQAAETKTDANGDYSLSGLEPGDRYYIEIVPSFPSADPTWQHQMPYIQTLPLTAEDSVELPEVNLLKLNQSISGIVVDKNGKPVSGASIGVKLRTGEHLAKMTPNGPTPWTVTDQRGRFQLKELPDAPLTILAYFANPKGGPVRGQVLKDIELNQKDIRIVLDPALRSNDK